MSTKRKPCGYIVLEQADEFEQVLGLDVSTGMPPGGILTWADDRAMRVFFPTRQEARAAIERTEHYRKAFGRTDLPSKAYCRIEPIAPAEA